MEDGRAKSIKAAEESEARDGGGFDLLNEDLVHNILSRLPAASFAQAACVNLSWNQICDRILSRPKFASALSLNPSLEAAVGETVDRALSTPIRPQFAIACVSLRFSLPRAHKLLRKRLGNRTPIITSGARGIIGRDAISGEFKEVQWEDDETEGGGDQQGICLFVGFIPGVKVDAIPSLRSPKTYTHAVYDKFVLDIREFSTITSGNPSPAAIMIFGDQESNMRTIVEKIDYAMPPGTVIVGNTHSFFLYGSSNCSSDVGHRRDCSCQCVALVFVRDRHKPQAGIGETHFHVTVSDGLRSVGNIYKAVSVRTPGVAKSSTWLTAKRDGSSEVLDGLRMVQDVDDELGNNNVCRDLFTGIIKRRKYSIGMENPLPMTTLTFHGVSGFNEEYLFLDGLGIKTGDSFQFYTSDSSVAISSCSTVCEELRRLKQNWTCQHCSPIEANADIAKTEVCGGFIFSCCGRGEWLFEKPNVDSSPLLDVFPDIPVAGLFCDGEIGRGCSSSIASGVQGTPRCPLHVYSSVYLVLSYTPTASQHQLSANNIITSRGKWPSVV
uniref:FIST C-domain domain-containing protein n=1 Tax=Kalanchoe fedtschenkoi TaxID=63787 RepID=A0A7N0RJA9_KALFE